MGKEEPRGLPDELTSSRRVIAEFRAEFAQLREEMREGLDAIDARFDTLESATNGHFAQLRKLIVDGHVEIMSAVMTLAKK